MTTRNETAMRRLLTTDEVAEILNIAPATIRDWRHEWDWKHQGPPPVKIGRAVRYRPEDVERYINEAVAS